MSNEKKPVVRRDNTTLIIGIGGTGAKVIEHIDLTLRKCTEKSSYPLLCIDDSIEDDNIKIDVNEDRTASNDSEQ